MVVCGGGGERVEEYLVYCSWVAWAAWLLVTVVIPPSPHSVHDNDYSHSLCIKGISQLKSHETHDMFDLFSSLHILFANAFSRLAQ